MKKMRHWKRKNLLMIYDNLEKHTHTHTHKPKTTTKQQKNPTNQIWQTKIEILHVDQMWPSQNEEQYTSLFWFCILRHVRNSSLRLSFPQFSLLIPFHSVFCKDYVPRPLLWVVSFCTLTLQFIPFFDNIQNIFFIFISNLSCHKQPAFIHR